MPKGKAFIVVGHKRWGKSKTLEALTGDDGNRLRKIVIKSNEFFIRRMSNDDVPKGFTKFVDSLDPSKKDYLIITLCPNFTDRLPNTKAILEKLTKNYQIFFFVLKHQWHNSGHGKEISDAEIRQLKNFGKPKKIKTYRKKGSSGKAKLRAKELRQYIESQL